MTLRRVRRPGRLCSLLLVLLLSACGAGWGTPAFGPSPAQRVITAGEIQDWGASNAWEVLERTGFHFPSSASALVPEPQARREQAHAPEVLVDGIPVLELRLLRDIPAHLISSVRILSSVVVIRTRR